MSNISGNSLCSLRQKNEGDSIQKLPVFRYSCIPVFFVSGKSCNPVKTKSCPSCQKISGGNPDKHGVTVDKHGGILDKHGGVWDKHGGISAYFGVTFLPTKPYFYPKK
jgi:hypothetical protein